MTTTEHLSRIRAKCVELLEIAERRTEGQWIVEEGTHGGKSVHGPSGYWKMGVDCIEADAAFIASCAGPAEAGWRATIAAIDQITYLEQLAEHWQHVAKPLRDAVIAAWPEELL